jgi:drug/metabolite transporter (DMT)-like permease
MSYALSFALLSLTAAGCLDVTFRRYALKARSRGMYVFGCGLVWALLQTAFIAGSGQGLPFGGTTLAYGLAAGLILVLANILLIESLTHLEVSLGSTIYRLNTILVVLLSFLFLGEALGPLKLTGIAFGIAAVLLLYGRPSAGGRLGAGFNAMGGSIPGLFLCAALTASALRAFYGILSKAALSEGAEAQGMLLTAALCWVLGGLAYAALRERRLQLGLRCRQRPHRGAQIRRGQHRRPRGQLELRGRHGHFPAAGHGTPEPAQGPGPGIGRAFHLPLGAGGKLRSGRPNGRAQPPGR